MPIRERQYPIRFVPRGLVDALDASEKFMGACTVLTNLVFDQVNPEIVVSRPGVGTALENFETFSTPGVISIQITVAGTVYGMIASALNAGKDQPFAYDHDTGTFIAISGITAANTPTTPASTGAWEPPTMAIVGTSIYVTHPGFAGANRFGVIDISTPSAPTWTATDTTTNGLSARPSAVANFANRAYFAIGNHLEYTDVLSLTRSAATQVLTIGDTSDITALSGLPVQTTSSGVVQALIVFKESQVWQITGDAATLSLSQNYLSLNIGCPAPRSVVSTPKGIYFINTAGPFRVTALGAVLPITFSAQEEVPDIVAPFQNCTEFTRVAAGYSGSIYRVCLDTLIQGVAGRNDYWFDELRHRWNGPHSFSYDCASQHENHFILSSNAAPAKLFHSHVRPETGMVYNDDGTATTATLKSSTFPKTGHMTQKQVVESTQELASSGVSTGYSITAVDDGENTLSSVTITTAGSGAVWGGFVWGDGTVYASATNRPRVYTVPWSVPLVFKKFAIQLTASASIALCIGAFFARYQDLGYTNYNADQGIPT